MLKKILIIFMLLFTLCSCSNKEIVYIGGDSKTGIELNEEASRKLISAFDNVEKTEIEINHTIYGLPLIITFKRYGKEETHNYFYTGWIDSYVCDPYDEFYDILRSTLKELNIHRMVDCELVEDSKNIIDCYSVDGFLDAINAELTGEKHDFETYLISSETSMSDITKSLIGEEFEEDISIFDYAVKALDGKPKINECFVYKNIEFKTVYSFFNVIAFYAKIK